MDVLATISFYASLVFGFGFGMIGLFQIGRIGAVQFFHWLSGVPPSRASCADNVGLTLGSAGIPTSFSDIVASLIGLGGLKSFTDLLSYLWRNVGETAFYFASIFGRILARLWVLVGIPFFALDIIVSRAGYEYWPTWFGEVGIHGRVQFIVAVVAFYIAAYTIGRAMGSPQRDFNKARILYEDTVATGGYWFDHRDESSQYAQHEPSLSKARALYDRLISVLERADDDMSRQRAMILQYQRGLLLSALREYDEAELAIEQCRRCKQMLAGSGIWEPQEEFVFESQLLFLEGELAYVRGDKEGARDKFKESQMIDESLGDSEGAAKGAERLRLVS